MMTFVSLFLTFIQQSVWLSLRLLSLVRLTITQLYSYGCVYKIQLKTGVSLQFSYDFRFDAQSSVRSMQLYCKICVRPTMERVSRQKQIIIILLTTQQTLDIFIIVETIIQYPPQAVPIPKNHSYLFHCQNVAVICICWIQWWQLNRKQFDLFIDDYNYNFHMDWVNPITKVNNKFKFQLFGRQHENLIHLYSQIYKYDPNNSASLSEHAFNLFLNASGVFLTTQEIRTIKDSFPSANGIAYRQFIDNVRNDMTQKRYAAIDHTFQQFQQNGVVSIATLLANLQPHKHPHVRSLSKKGEKSQQDIEEGLRYWSSDKANLTHEAFTEYFKDANACIPLQRQEFFVDLLIHTFGLFQNGVTNERILQLQVTVYERVRQRTQIKKDQGTRSNAAFQFIDLEEKKLIDFLRFVAVLDRIGCRFTDKECKALFYKHSRGNNLLSYEDLCGLLFHMGSGVKDNVNPVFELARSGEGFITTHGMTKKLH